MNLNINLEGWYNLIREIAFKILIFPFRVWRSFPWWLRLLVDISLIIIALLVIRSSYRNRNSYHARDY